jgi:hypothetical protein
MAPKQNPQFPTRRPGLVSAPTARTSPTRATKGTESGAPILSVQASKYPCDFKTELPAPNWKQAHLTWPPYPGSDWPSYVSPIAVESPLLIDNATGKVFFVGADGKVYDYYWEDDHDWEIQALNWNQGVQIDPAGGLRMNNGKLFCIGTDKKGYNFYYQGGAWQFNALVTNQYALVDARGGLAFDQIGKVFVIGTDGKVYNYYLAGNAWAFNALNPNQSMTVDARGNLAVDQTGKVFTVGTDGKVYNYYWTGNAWAFHPLNPSQYATIDARGGLAIDQMGKVFAVGTDGKVYNYYWNGRGWDFNWLNPNQYAVIDARGKLLVDSHGKVYAIGVDGKVYNYYWVGNGWAFDWLVPNPYMNADPIGGLKMDAVGKLFVIGTDGKLYNYYWTGASWAFDRLSPLQTDAARASNQLAVGDAVYFASQSGNLEVFYYSDGQINYNDWDLVYDEDFTTSTITTLQNDWMFQFPWGHTQAASILAGYEWGYNWDNALSISGGNLHITADNQPVWANLVDWQAPTDIMSDGKPNYRQFDFTGGVMTAKAAHTYGLFEITCRFPAGKGFWPAFWLIVQGGWPPEIDVLEFDGTLPMRCSNNVHWRINPNATEACGMEYGTSQDLTQGHHKYSMAWFPEKIIMYFDGQELRTIDHHVPQTPMQVIIGMGIGIHYPDATTPFPSSFDVDYVRFYKHK